MQLQSIKAIVAMVWGSAMLIAGLAGHVQSLSGWTALVALAIFPPLVVTWRWHAPGQSMSESIQKALR